MFGERFRAAVAGAGPIVAARRRWLAISPFLALVAVLALSVHLTFDRNAELSSTQRQLDNAARQEFVNEIELAEQHLASEIDRLIELMAGIAAFTTASNEPAEAAVDAYIAGTGATDRFAGLLDTLVITRPQSGAGGHRALLTFDLADGSGTADRAIDASALHAALRSSIVENGRTGPFLSSHEIDGREIQVVTFPLTPQPDGQWAALVFASDGFLNRAMSASRRHSTSLLYTGEPVESSSVDETEAANIPVRRTDDGRLTADMALDVFGTEVVLQTRSAPGLLETTDRTQLWVLIAAGAALALGLYSALRGLTESRELAIESARTATHDRAVLDRRLRASFELAPIGMAEIDAVGRLVEANPALCDQVGRRREAILGRPLSMLVHKADRDAHVERVESLLDGSTDAVQGEHRFRRADGRDVWVHESISMMTPDEDGQRTWLVQCQDITAQRHAAWELAQQALHDDLTGLPNRALFLNRLKHALVRAARERTRVAVMFIDIDRFKVINDSLGHKTGDDFLRQISERIGTAVRAGDTVARFGGDEFVVLCESVESESEAAATAQRIQAVFNTPFVLNDQPTYATASVGITLSAAGESSADALLRDADAAMYRAKESGRNRTEMFDHSMRSANLARMEIESQLRSALENGEIVMHFQAIVDPLTHVPVGYEALVRWNHPEKGLLGPGAFLPVAEEAGLIHLIDSFALRSACEHIAKWVDAYPAARNLYVATNWSARHLGRFLQQVDQILVETRIDPHQLVIEVTEGFLLEDSEASLQALQQLKQLGVQIAIDDFGTGYSSLAYLTQFAVDYLKIDQSFVSKLPDDEASAAVIGAIADMATRLGIKLVAEGVETEEQIRMLASLGAPRLQGYRFAKPRPAHDIEHQLALRSGHEDDDPHDADADGTRLPWASISATSVSR